MTTEQEWSDALVREEAHQQELLAAFRGDVAGFAKECAAGLDALDAYIGSLGGIVSAIDAAKTGQKHASIVLDVARRLPSLGRGATDDEDAELMRTVGEGGGVPDRLVTHARTTLAEKPSRSDAKLLLAVSEASGAKGRIEELIGPAAVAGFAGLTSLARLIPRFETAEAREAETARARLRTVLDAAVADAKEEAAGALESARAALGRASDVAEKKAKSAAPEYGAELHADLKELRALLADAPADRAEAWAAELEALEAEVREKLARIERLHGWLKAIAPRMRLASKALSTGEKVRGFAGGSDVPEPPSAAETAEAARLSVLIDLAGVWDPLLGPVGVAPAEDAADRQAKGLGTRVWVGAGLAALAAAVALGFLLLRDTGDASAAPLPGQIELYPNSSGTLILQWVGEAYIETLVFVPDGYQVLTTGDPNCAPGPTKPARADGSVECDMSGVTPGLAWSIALVTEPIDASAGGEVSATGPDGTAYGPDSLDVVSAPSVSTSTTVSLDYDLVIAVEPGKTVRTGRDPAKGAKIGVTIVVRNTPGSATESAPAQLFAPLGTPGTFVLVDEAGLECDPDGCEVPELLPGEEARYELVAAKKLTGLTATAGVVQVNGGKTCPPEEKTCANNVFPKGKGAVTILFIE